MKSLKFNLPSSVNLNSFKAYVNFKNIQQTSNKFLDTINLEWNVQEPKSLRILVLDFLVQNWNDNPILFEIPEQKDRIYMLDNIDGNLPIKILSAHIKEDIFWKRCFTSRWRKIYPNVDKKSWLIVYMEKHLSETLENMEPCDYDQEGMQAILDVCAPYIFELDINYLQPSMGERTDHIPFDFILANLPELKKFSITYCTKTIGPNYYLGCSSISRNDITYLCRGLQKCYDLVELDLHNCKIEPYMLKNLSRCLDKGCSNLEILSIPHCRCEDAGLVNFLSSLSAESFLHIKHLVLSNNFLSQQSALRLSEVLKGRKIEHLDLRLNPIGTEGTGTLLAVIFRLPIKVLNMSGCSITESIGRMLLRLLIEHKTLRDIDFSNNLLGEQLGKNIYKIIGFNKVLQRLDIRNTDISPEILEKIYSVIFENRDKL